MRRLSILLATPFAIALVAAAPSQMPIWPKQAATLKPVSLGELVFRALPGQQSLSWDMLQISSIRWITDGIETTETGYSLRHGIARARASGAIPQMLRQSWVELPWTISLESSGNAKFGPEKITFTPGLIDPDHICFGTRFKGCSFPSTAISYPGLTLKKLCELGPGSAHSIVYAASTMDRRHGIVVYRTDAGSGDSTNAVEVLPGDAGRRCARGAEL